MMITGKPTKILVLSKQPRPTSKKKLRIRLKSNRSSRERTRQGGNTIQSN